MKAFLIRGAGTQAGSYRLPNECHYLIAHA
jgi:hypothetical protein